MSGYSINNITGFCIKPIFGKINCIATIIKYTYCWAYEYLQYQSFLFEKATYLNSHLSPGKRESIHSQYGRIPLDPAFGFGKFESTSKVVQRYQTVILPGSINGLYYRTIVRLTSIIQRRNVFK